MPNLGEIFELEVIADRLLCLVASDLDVSTLDLVSFRIGIYVLEVGGQILRIVSFAVMVDGRIEDPIQSARQLLVG